MKPRPSTQSIDIAQAQTAAQRRHAERMQRRVLDWWEALPEPSRGPFYSIAHLANLTDLPAASLGPVLRELDWQREEVRVGGVQRAIWLPPGAASQKKPAGRPRLLPTQFTH